MKYAPNIITGFRILGSISLLFLTPLSRPFFLLYAFCGVSDMFDGCLARVTGNTSKTGAMLDSLADIVFTAVALLIFIPAITLPVWASHWIIGIALIRLSSLVVGCIKYRAFAALHTYANKATGLILFCFPFLYQINGINQAVYPILIMASLSALEEIIINIISPSLNRDIKSIFKKRHKQ